jgi:DNA invertase Pin-like site-specific DNA recombinase
MLIGYIRVSKSDGSQVLDLQRDALCEAGVAPGRVYEDLASGHKDDRPGLAACVKALQPGNTLVIWSLDRLGRDLKHLVGLIDTLHQQQVGLKVLAGAGAQIDTTTTHGRLVFGIFAALAEFEAALIRERTQAGLRAARARGRHGGVRESGQGSGLPIRHHDLHFVFLCQRRRVTESDRTTPTRSQQGRMMTGFRG